MKQIDLEPTGYRKQHRETGRWVQNIDKPLCRWMALAVIAFLIFFVWHYRESAPVGPLAFFGVMGFFAGGLIVLSLKSTDW